MKRGSKASMGESEKVVGPIDWSICCSVAKSLTLSTPWTAALQASLPLTISWSLPKLMSIELWCHLTISSSVALFFCLQSFPASGSFPICQYFASDGQSIGVSALASVLPMSMLGWFPLRLTGLISLLSDGLSRVFSSTIVWKHQFFGILPSLWSSSDMCICLWKN